MLGNLHVRFGERDGETWLREELKRFIPTLLLWLVGKMDARLEVPCAPV